MNKNTPVVKIGRDPFTDALTEILREGARSLLLSAVQDELEAFFKEHADKRLLDGRAAVVRNGYLPKRTI